jgi:hypothetical protein
MNEADETKMENKYYYLVEFVYDYYCQGWESTRETLLVHAPSFEAACNRIKIVCDDRGYEVYKNPTDFKNKTLIL